MDNELLQAISQMMSDQEHRLSQMMDSKLEPINARLDTMQGDIADIKDDIDEIKEKLVDIDDSIGAIADWADTVATVTKIPFAGGSTSIN